MIGRARASSLILVVTLTTAVACSGGDEASAGVSADSACDQTASAVCDRVGECAPFYLATAYDNREDCIARFKINCATSFTANGTSATPSRLAECATAVRAASCVSLLGRDLPDACKTAPGALSDGAVCGHDAQCKNRLCRIARGSTCGACSSLGGTGTSCERDAECDYGLECVSKRCLAKGRSGVPCNAAAPCVGSLGCVNGACGAPLAEGAACTFKADENPCDGAKGFYCSPKTERCVKIEVVASNGRCEVSRDAVIGCGGGAECKIALGATTGTCEAPAADGATCNDDKGPKCMAPARCTSGVCTIVDPAKCN